ncbi:hypothetical protein LPJ53_003500 [Coemansia erecta]|uniref:CST complex subunit CTC1 n=1 Tax=Coemansia erecta TaxID=147472 RepID=A0A9W7XZY7_9FUNG|nr:hypothetical protein LPJ53_003500 [Coemansia erecta]
MLPSSTVRICSLNEVRTAAQSSSRSSQTDSPPLTSSVSADSSGTIHALLGTFQVVQKTESFAYPPYMVRQGTLVFVDRSSSGSSHPEIIACRALGLNTSWFDDSVCMLVTNWRYLGQPKGLSSKQGDSLAYIEILLPPLIVPATVGVPEPSRDLSWWTQRRASTEYDHEEQFTRLMHSTAVTSGNRAAQALLDGRQQAQPMSVCGRVCAVSTLIGTSDSTNDSPVFIIDLSLDTRPPASLSYNNHVVTVPIAFSGPQYLGLFASTQVGDSLLVSDIRPFTLLAEDRSPVPVLATTVSSQAFRVDEFDGLSDSQMCVAHTQTVAFSQASELDLYSQISHSREPPTVSRSPASHMSVEASTSNVDADGGRLVVDGMRLESYEGVVTRMLDLTLGIYVIDDSHVLVLAYWPHFAPSFVLRPGTRVLLDNVHVVLLSNSSGYRWSWLTRVFPDDTGDVDATDGRRALVFGACARSSVRITGFAGHSDSGTARVVLDMEVAAALARRAGGIVRLIEAAEAFWKLAKKFPHGPVAARANSDGPRQLLGMALAWAGAAQEPHRRINLEFLRHRKHCQSSSPASTRRVCTLKSVLQRFVAFRDVGRRKRRLDDGHVGLSAAEVGTLSASPAELGLENTPLVGRLVVSQRGQLFLWDGTAHMLVHPSFASVSCGSEDSAAQQQQQQQPLFPGQQLVGHVYSWNSWRIVTETVNVASISRLRTDNPGSGGSGSGGTTALQQSPDFELTYAVVSSPAIVYADPTFGGIPTHRSGPLIDQSLASSEMSGNGSNSGSGSGSSAEHPLCFVFLVHWKEAVAPRPADIPAAHDKRLLSDSTPWASRILVRGKALKISLDDFYAQLQGAMDARPVISISAPEPNSGGSGGSRGGPPADWLENCVLRYSPAKVAAVFTPGSAFVICVRSSRQTFQLCDEKATAAGIFGVGLGSRDHVYPVHLVVDGRRHVSSSPLHMTRHLPVPTVSIVTGGDGSSGSSSSSMADRLRVPETCSVGGVLGLAGPGGAGFLVSVHGTVVQRRINGVVEFISPGTGGHASANASDSAASARGSSLVSGMLDTQILLGSTDDLSTTVLVYLKLHTYAHPLGLLPGAHVVFRNVSFNTARATGNVYLTSTMMTTIEHVDVRSAASLLDDAPGALHCDASAEATRVCIGELYCRSSAEEEEDKNGGRRVSLNCRIQALEQLSVLVECTECGVVVSDTCCQCISRRHRMVDGGQAAEAYGGGRATVRPRVEALCRVADGSGIGRVVMGRAHDVVLALGLSSGDFEALCWAAARSWGGQVVWKRPVAGYAGDAGPGRRTRGLGDVGMAAAAADGVDTRFAEVVERVSARVADAGVLVEGWLSLGSPGAWRKTEQQTLRMDGLTVAVTRRAVPRIVATKVVRMGSIENCWMLLNDP